MIKIVAGRKVTIKNAVPGASGFNAMVKALLEGRRKALEREAAALSTQTNDTADSQNFPPGPGSEKPIISRTINGKKG